MSDAARGNWVDRRAPAWSRPYLRLSRADRPIGTWLLLLPSWWAIGLGVVATGWQAHTAWLFLGSAIGAWLMRGAGCTWNDLRDRDIDARVARTRSRPIPSGQVTPKAAFAWLIVQCLLAFLILVTFNPLAIALGVLSLAPVAVYPFAKRFTNWPQVFLGIAFNWGALLLWAAQTGSLAPAAVALYAAGIFWTLHYDTIYAHQDREDDRLIGVGSSALALGERTRPALIAFAGISLGFAVLSALLAGSSGPAVCGALAFGAHLVWQARRFDADDPDRCLELFRANKGAGLLLMSGIAVDWVV